MLCFKQTESLTGRCRQAAERSSVDSPVLLAGLKVCIGQPHLV